MYATDRQTDVRRASSLNAPYPKGGGIIIVIVIVTKTIKAIKWRNCLAVWL